MKVQTLTCSLFFLFITGCTSSQIDTGVKLATQSFGVNIGSSQQSTINDQANYFKNLSDAQKKQILSQLTLGESKHSGQLKIAIGEAKSTIFTSLAILSCSADNNPPSSLSQFSLGGSYPFSLFSTPLSRIGKNKNQCVTVKSIDNWEIDENGKIKFTVVYVANDTQQTVRAHYFMQKNSNKWLFYRSYIS